MILAYIQNFDGKLKKASFEIASYAAAIAKMANTQVLGVVLGQIPDDQLQQLSKYGVNKLINVTSPNLEPFDPKVYTEAVAKIAENNDITGFVFINNNEGRAIAPRIAARFKAGIVSAVTQLPESLNPLTITKKVFTGKAFAKTIVKSDKFVLTLFQNSYGLQEEPVDMTTEKVELDLPAPAITVIEKNVDTSGKVPLTEAEIVVSGGRGMKGPEYWGPLEEFARLLGAATACSRPVADEGWRPASEHVGQTGKIIAPTVYFAFGISGAIQHIGGVSNSKYIVAVNIDKDAPIFEVADYGIVGDAHKILPELIEAVKKLKQSES